MIKIFNNNNDILIDGEKIHPHLHQHVSQMIYAGHIVGGAYGNSRYPKITTVNFPPIDTPPFIGINSGGMVVNFMGFNTNSNNQYVSFDVAPPIYSKNDTVVDFYIYSTEYWGSSQESHGIEVFDSSGGRIFHSGRETLDVVQSGSESIHLEYGTDDKKRIYFPPQKDKPKVWVGSTGAYVAEPIYFDLGRITIYYKAFFGDFKKNSNNEWDSFLVDVGMAKQLEQSDGGVTSFEGQMVWDFPYVVLI